MNPGFPGVSRISQLKIIVRLRCLNTARRHHTGKMEGLKANKRWSFLAAHRTHNRSPSMHADVKWQYKKRKEGWLSFDPHQNAQINAAQHQGLAEVRLSVDSGGDKGRGKDGVLDLSKMELILKNQRGRAGRCKVRKTGGRTLSSDTVRSLLSRVDEATPAEGSSAPGDNFMPPHHLIYKTLAVGGYLAPTVCPRAAVGVAGRLVVTAIRGRALFDTQTISKQDPYLRFSLEGESRAKKVHYPIPECVGGGRDPVWNHVVELPVSSEDRYLRVSVLNKNTIADSVIGRTRLPLEHLIPFINPIIAFNDESLSHTADAKKSPKNAALFHTHQRGPFIMSRKEAQDCAGYSLRSWFQLVREWRSTANAGQILLEFRFLPYRASKLRFWNRRTAALRNTPSTKKQQLDAKICRQGKLFAQPLEVGVSMSETLFPAPVFDCIEYLLTDGASRIDEEGIFRVPGNADRIADMRLRYDQHKEVRLSGTPEVAGLLKLYFRTLPEPLIPRTLFDPLIAADDGGAAGPQRRIETYKVVVSMMPRLARDTLQYLAEFLLRVADRASVNKMEAKNLAVCWAPTLMRGGTDEKDPKMVYLIPKTIAVITDFISHCDAIFSPGVTPSPMSSARSKRHRRSTGPRLPLDSLSSEGVAALAQDVAADGAAGSPLSPHERKKSGCVEVKGHDTSPPRRSQSSAASGMGAADGGGNGSPVVSGGLAPAGVHTERQSRTLEDIERRISSLEAALTRERALYASVMDRERSSASSHRPPDSTSADLPRASEENKHDDGASDDDVSDASVKCTTEKRRIQMFQTGGGAGPQQSRALVTALKAMVARRTSGTASREKKKEISKGSSPKNKNNNDHIALAASQPVPHTDSTSLQSTASSPGTGSRSSRKKRGPPPPPPPRGSSPP